VTIILPLSVNMKKRQLFAKSKQRTICEGHWWWIKTDNYSELFHG